MATNAEKPGKRLNLVVSEELWNELEIVSAKRSTTVTALIRSFIRLGLLATKVEDEPGSVLIIREGKQEQQLFLV